MSTRSQPNWETIASEWDAFVEWVVRKEGAKYPYLRDYVEAAIEEWTDMDGLSETEGLAQQLVELCPRARTDFSRAFYSYPDEYDRAPVSVRLDNDLIDEYRRIVDEQTDHRGRYGYVLAKVLNQYRTTGGRLSRINDRLRDALDVLGAAEITLPDDYTRDETNTYDPDADGTHYMDVRLHKLDKRTRTYQRYLVCQNLDPDTDRNLHMNVVRDAVRQNVGDAPAGDDEFIREILETLNYVPHPNNPSSGVYVSEQRADEITDPDTETSAASADLQRIADIDRGGFHDLSKPERLTKIRLAMVREMCRKGQRTRRFDYNFIKNRVFDHEPSASYANKAVEKVETNEGAIKFTTKHGTKRAQVSLPAFAEECPTLWAYLQNERERERADTSNESETSAVIATDGGVDGG